ncbi:hypothetical protein NZ698_11850 [Chryseobacterium sp. PBS4-4]|uniref:Nuclear transport factor 2 family protein n=1 Tax=Chryseobacterium edaphi TaxID=2976532 RepID=A0ABT2W6P9_9FLAO|nr:hypothetical protein [Chryseobacterium edaphi]MCU7617892.1 hypothetical protein [Chryseobacterium edaphi]
MQIKHFVIIIFLLFSCTKRDYDHNEFENINVSDEEQVNNFIQFFIENLDDKNDILSLMKNIKYYGSKLEKDSILLKPERWLITKTQRDSLFTDEDLVFVRQQIIDEKDYSFQRKNFRQKIVNSDSLKNENIKFSNWQSEKTDSLRKISISKAKEYIADGAFREYHSYIKKNTPILYINKPIFLKDKNKVIFSYYTYSGYLNARSETAIFEFKNGKWYKLKIIYARIS